jgi:hypothetical protein
MKLTKVLFAALVLSLSNYIYGQAKKIESIDIKLGITHYMKTPNNSIEISLQREKRNKKTVKVIINPINLSNRIKDKKYERISNIKDTLFYIPIEKYIKIVNSLKLIKQEDIYNSLSEIGIDGYSTKLEFGNSSNSITYNVFGPTYRTEERKLQYYLNVCSLIIESVNLKLEEFLDFD